MKGFARKAVFFAVTLWLSVGLSGCISYTLTNMVKARKGVDAFYLTIQQQHYDKALGYYSSRFLATTSRDEMREVLANVKSMAGTYERHQLIRWRATVQNERGPVVQMLYRVTYSQGYTFETMLVSPDGSIHMHEIVFIDEFGKEMPLIAI